MLLALAIPLVCIPVRGQEEGPGTPATATPASGTVPQMPAAR